MTWTHDNLTGFMGNWFIDRAWQPAMIEAPIGWVKDGNKRNLGQHYDFSHYPAETRRHIHDRAWIADVAGTCHITPSHMKNMGLYMHDIGSLQYDTITWLCEVKVGRADFRQDDKWDKPPQAHVQFLAMPRGIIQRCEVPDGWGYLEVWGGGDQARVHRYMKRLRVNAISDERQADFALSLLHTLWHRDRYKAQREEMQRYAAKERAMHDAGKVGNIAVAVAEYMAGVNPYGHRESAIMSLALHLEHHGIMRHVSKCTLEEINRIRARMTMPRAATTCRR